MSATVKRRSLLIGALLVLSLAFTSLRGLWEPDEGRYVVVACMMLDSGNFLEPKLNHEQPHWTKPPLTYWVLAGSIHAFGRNTMAARLPIALAFVFTVLATHAIARELAPGREMAAAIVQATALMPFAGSNVVTTDGLLAMFETLAALGFARALFGPATSRGPWLAAGWVAVGFGFLTKGPPALLVLLPVFALRLSRVRRAKGLLAWELAGLAGALAVALPWFLIVVHRHPDLLEYFLKDEVAARILSDQHHRNAGWLGALKAYWGVVLLGPLPWTWPLLRSAAGRVRELFKREKRIEPEVLFLLLWVALPGLVLLLSQSRQPLYALPFFVPASLLVARVLHDGWNAPWGDSRRRLLLGGWLVVLLGLRVVAATLPADRDAEEFSRRVTAIAPGPWQEVVFFDTRPYFGAALYLDVEIEPIFPGSEEELIDELREVEPSRLLVLEERSVERLERAAEATGRRLRDLGSVSGWKDYRLFADEPR